MELNKKNKLVRAGYRTMENTKEQLLLRPFFDDDMSLLERWLRAEHVKPWYEKPEEWLEEIRERHDEFRFITHLIAEADGKAIGFCQYYDCYYSKEYEDWGMEIPLPGKVYSVDYLIGEREYLRRGYAKAMLTQMIQRLRVLDANAVIVLPDAKNIASNKTLEASGFVWDGDRYWFRLKGV